MSTTPFLGFRLSEGTQRQGRPCETFQMSNVDYATRSPEPGTLLLIGSGLAGLALRRRRRS